MPARRRSRPPSGRVRARAPRTIALPAEDGRARVEIDVKEVARAKLLRLRIRTDGTVGVTVPAFTSDRRIDRFIVQNEDWIAQALAEHDMRASRLGYTAVGRLPLAGELVPLVRTRGRRSVASLRTRDGEVVVALSGPGSAEPAALERFLRDRARVQGLELIALHAPSVGAQAGRVRIADPVTRWGSASTTGTISFSWRLALAPIFVFEYVVVHELCHLLELNHSARFWAHVTRVLPDSERPRSWLREHGVELRSWRPAAALS